MFELRHIVPDTDSLFNRSNMLEIYKQSYSATGFKEGRPHPHCLILLKFGIQVQDGSRSRPCDESRKQWWEAVCYTDPLGGVDP